jgi:hypothetical protein
MKVYFLISISILQVLFLSAQDSLLIEMQRKYEENILKEEINGVYIPKDMTDAFLELDKLSSPDSKLKIIEGEEEIVTQRLSMGLGKWMIVHWNFYEGSRMSHYLKTMGVSHPDDMAQYVIGSYFRYLKELPLDLEARADSFFQKRKEEQDERNSKRVTIVQKSEKP